MPLITSHKEVKSKIIDLVGEYYSIIVDETMDIAKFEQISFCIRYCDDHLKVHEKFLGSLKQQQLIRNHFII